MKNWYGYNVNDDDGCELFADSENDAIAWIKDQYGCDDKDISICQIGEGDPDHWENEHMTNI